MTKLKRGVSISLILAAALPGLLWAKKKATLQLAADTLFFSPNRDGIKDSVTFRIQSEGIRSVVGWEIQFVDATGVVRKTISGTKSLPESTVWNGQDEFGAPAPEGVYNVALRLWDSKNDQFVAEPLRVVLDLTPPTLSLSAAEKSLRARDGLAEPATFYFSAVDLSGIAEWKLQVMDVSRQEFYASSSSGSLPAAWSWPAKTAKLPQGKAILILHVMDAAGNRGSSPPLEMAVEGAGAARPAAAAPVPQRSLPTAPAPETPAARPEAPAAPAPAQAYHGPYLQMTSIISVADLFGNGADNQSQLSPRAAVLLEPLADALLNHPGSRAMILGHVDPQSNPPATKSLSSYFAWRVFSYFVKTKGVGKQALAVKGLGAGVPIADNRSSLGRSRNRRIEIQLYFPSENR